MTQKMIAISPFTASDLKTPHVVVVGEVPPVYLHQRIEAALTSGVIVNLREDVLRYLLSRREEMTQLAPWVERHYNHGEDV